MAASEVCRSLATELTMTLASMTAIMTMMMVRPSAAAGYNDSLSLSTEEQLLELRITEQNLHVDYIEKQLDKLEAEVNELSPVIDKFTLSLLWLRIVNLEDVKPCGSGEVACGGGRPGCIHELFVCDGIKDCGNGRDEDEIICRDNVITPGSTFRGVIHWHRCVTATDHYVTFTVVKTTRSPFFRSRTLATFFIEFYDKRFDKPYKYMATGYFTFGTRQLVLAGPLAEGSSAVNVVICFFNRGNNDQAKCTLVLESTQEECAVFRLDRV